MDRTVAIVMPAYRAEETIAASVASVISQTFADWQLWIVADDGADYEAFLARAGLADSRLRFLDSGGTRRGASLARNVALDAIDTPYAAILDADDRMQPEKLARVISALDTHGIVSTALDVMTLDFSHLRYVGTGPDRVLTPGEHKWVSISMDSMIAWDRRKADGRYDAGMSNMTDLEFLLQLYRTVPVSMHLGTPLHDYVKRDGSMSNARNVAAGMIASKREILSRLESGHYGLPQADVEGLAAFLAVSLEAEERYEAAAAKTPGLLFEDHLEPMLAVARLTTAAS
ncbi:glycosyltransferase family 2 protein [Devosia geojensis]|uniref:glycosyltransferase family 2 protein n=1 Tax=Devosia geojensis TaxID=443610 RepID=UPI0006980A78|nr:glycosyltransferase family A protein [Devosia geojensis]